MIELAVADTENVRVLYKRPCGDEYGF